MAKTISVDELSSELEKALTEFVGATEEACEKGVIETAKEAVESLRTAHPSGSGQYGSWDKYNSGWTIMQTKTDKRYHREATVHNATHYQLTHLLEHGHALWNGGRAGAFPHIAPVAEKCEGELVENIKKYM